MDTVCLYTKGCEIGREEDQEVVCKMSKQIKHEACLGRRIWRSERRDLRGTFDGRRRKVVWRVGGCEDRREIEMDNLYTNISKIKNVYCEYGGRKRT